MIALAGLFATSCLHNTEPLTVLDMSNVTVPVLEAAPAGVALASDGTPIALTFSAVDYGFQCGKTYTLYASATQDFAKTEKVDATISGTTATFTQTGLNTAILNLGGEPGVSFTIYYRLSAWATNDKNSAISSTLVNSNVISATYTPYNMLLLEKDVYGHIWVQGSYCDWKHANSQFLYNYAKDEKIYEGVVDFGTKASAGIKFTGADNWDAATGNWGCDDALGAEAGSFTLVNGSNTNITCYSKRFYHFTMDKSSLKVTKDWGADFVSIIGLNGDWNKDIDMSYNPDYVRFWADINVPAATSMKFRADHDWTINWGVGCKAGGDNIDVQPGNWRVYLDLNKKVITLSASMYGKEEPSSKPAAPAKPAAWSLIGTLNGTSWNADTDLSNTSGDIWMVRGVTVTASDEFKIRADHKWDTSVGGPEANSKSTIDPTNPYDVFKPTLGTAFATGDKNIQIGEAGKYDVTFDYANSKVLIAKHITAYSLIGEINGDSWTADVIMTKSGDVWTSPAVNITGGFKIRYDYSWDAANTYGAADGFVPTIGTAFTAVQPGANITVPASGNYKVSFNSSTKAVTITAVANP